MSFGLGRGRELDDAPGVIGVAPAELPPLPDDVLANPEAARIDPRRWFHDPSRPFEIEIGCGKGSFILNHAAANPGINILGIEWAGEFYAYAADRVRRRQLPNVRMLRADASEFLRWRCPPRIASVIHLYFSDPWPKKRHHKNRVIQDRFLQEAHRVLIPGGELRIVTDHDELWEWDVEHFRRACTPDSLRAFGLVPAEAREPFFDIAPFTPPEWVGEGETVGTNYEKKMCGDTKRPHSCTLRAR